MLSAEEDYEKLKEEDMAPFFSAPNSNLSAPPETNSVMRL